ncbi:MAG: endonuclease/exonuclease/phosphatase family protein [Kiritimatiellae bacterium]|nr:endonuclease/exonuclease/phosphatase family protein [Kiritimatiellia bacterium]
MKKHTGIVLFGAVLALGMAGCATEDAAPSGKPLTMMSFNIRMGCGLKDPFKIPEGELGHLPQCAEVIRRFDPDWVAVQEIDRGTKRAGHVDQTAELARLCGLHGTFVKKVPRPDGDYGLAVLSKEKPLGVSKILMPGSSHTRCVEIVEFKDYIVACTHFPLKESFRVRAAEIVRLNLADREKPVFLAGDLNALPESPEIAELKKGFTILSDTSKPTFRADNPSKCIDYIMVDTAHADAVKVRSYEVIADTNATDHCALVLKTDFSGGVK